MKTLQLTTNKKNRITQSPVYGIAFFFIIFGSMLLMNILIRRHNQVIFYLLLFFTGWFAWTFLEYMSHRFLMHHSKQTNFIDFNHEYHHTHPTEIKITTTMRFLLLIGCAILITISALINNYFTLAAGFLCGFPVYTFIHFFLHQKNTQKFFGKMTMYHIYHHCKNPNKCFGISVTWWDELFGTIPPKKAAISPKVINFYFGEKKSKYIHVIKNFLLLGFNSLLLHYSMAQQKSLHYDVERNGNKIGYLTVKETIKDNKTFIELQSEVKTRFIFSYSNYTAESVLIENGNMFSSNYYQKENGKETINSITEDGNYFKLVSNGHVDLQNFSPVHNNYLQLFCHFPGTETKIYSNHYQGFLDVKKISENKYRVSLPDGNYNYYSYENGVCTLVDVERTFFTIHFVLKDDKQQTIKRAN